MAELTDTQAQGQTDVKVEIVMFMGQGFLASNSDLQKVRITGIATSSTYFEQQNALLNLFISNIAKKEKKKSVICNCNLAIPHLQTEMGNSPIPFAEFMVHYSPTAKDVKFSMDIKWIRKFMFIHQVRCNRGALQILFQFPNGELPIVDYRGLLAQSCLISNGKMPF